MRQGIRRGQSCGLLFVLLLGLGSGASFARSEASSPPSPVHILSRRDLEAPFLDAVLLCVPSELEGVVDPALEKATAGSWKEAHAALARLSEPLEGHAEALAALASIFTAREATTRAKRLVAEELLHGLAREQGQRKQQDCLGLERARLLMLLDRPAEAAAELTRVDRTLKGEGAWEKARIAGIEFSRAEILYRLGRRFEARMAYRKIARAENPRLALAARLRLTDLSFEAGKLDAVSLEYEPLLPRATAFGGAIDGWSLRAAEAALDSGDPARSLGWLERYLDSTKDRDARDVAEIRHADLEVRFQDPLAARKRLAALASRRKSDPIGVLAAVRSVDLDVFEGSAEERLEILAGAIQHQRHGLRRYAMGVLMRDLASREDFEASLAVATRLAYDGVDSVVVPDYTAMLDGLLVRLVKEGDAGCGESVRALGGRYGILIQRASSIAPFAQLGRCFERMELPWLAVPVYRSISRRFGTQGASDIALSLARASLASDDVSLARHMADAALVDSSPDSAAWQAILAEVDFREGRTSFAMKRAQSILDARDLGLQRSSLALAMARAAARGPSMGEARFLAARLSDWLKEEAGETRSIGRLRLLEAGLVIAHALRRASVPDEAFVLYRAVDRYAEAGPLRSSARFWLGIARQVDQDGKRAWGEDVDRTLGSPWARVAGFEARFESLRDVYAEVLEQ